MLAKSVRFLEHVSPGCCTGVISRVSCRYPYPRESVHIKILVSSVSFSHNNVRLLMVYLPYASTHGLSSLRKVCLPCDLPFARLSLYRRSNRRTDRQTELSTTVTLAAHAREG